jgi:hypothetical protein
MAEKQEEFTKAAMDNPDLGLDVLMTMPFKQLKKEVIRNNKNMKKIAIDEQHVRVLTLRILCKNADAIEKFNKISILLTVVILVMMAVEVIVAVYK